MMTRDGTGDDPRFAEIELATYVSGGRLIVIVNQSEVCIARLVLTPFDLGAGVLGLLQAIARHSLPVTVTLGEPAKRKEARHVEADSARS